MATVTGLTADRMIEMENATVIDGEVQGDDLHLITRGGTNINAGSVRGAQGVQGVQGPQGPIGPPGPTGPEGPVGPAGPVALGSLTIVSARRAGTATSVPSSTEVALNFDYISPAVWSSTGAAPNSVLIVPVGDEGWYQGQFTVDFTGAVNPATRVIARTELNGVDRAWICVPPVKHASTPTRISVPFSERFVAGDQFKCYVNQNAGVNVPTMGWLEMTRIST